MVSFKGEPSMPVQQLAILSIARFAEPGVFSRANRSRLFEMCLMNAASCFDWCISIPPGNGRKLRRTGK